MAGAPPKTPTKSQTHPRKSTRVRRATIADLSTLVDHRVSMWRDIGGYSERELGSHAPLYRRWAGARLRSGELVGFVAESPGGDIQGSGCIWIQEAQPRPRMPQPSTPYILSMYTDPNHRARGVATRIVRGMLAYCRSRRFPRVMLHASPQGRPVYAKLGFERTWEMRRWIDPSLARRDARRKAILQPFHVDAAVDPPNPEC